MEISAQINARHSTSGKSWGKRKIDDWEVYCNIDINANIYVYLKQERRKCCVL